MTTVKPPRRRWSELRSRAWRRRAFIQPGPNGEWDTIITDGSLPGIEPYGRRDTPWGKTDYDTGPRFVNEDDLHYGNTDAGSSDYDPNTPVGEFSLPVLDTPGNIGYPGNHNSSDSELNGYGTSQGDALGYDSESIYGYVTGVSFSDDYSQATMTLNTGETVTTDTTAVKGEGDSITYGDMANYSHSNESGVGDTTGSFSGQSE